MNSTEQLNLTGRLCSGATIGLFLAALASLVVTLVFNQNITSWIQKDSGGDQLIPVKWAGFTPEELHLCICVGLVFCLPILFASLQVKPRFPLLATTRWFYITMPLTVFAVLLATYYFVTSQMKWMWLYQ